MYKPISLLKNSPPNLDRIKVERTTRINIREATQNDLDLIVQFTLSLHAHEDDGEITASEHFADNLSKWLLVEINNPQSLFLIAEKENSKKNDSAVGFIGAASVINDNGFLTNPAKGLIQLLWVEEKSRKSKVAGNLVKEIEHCFKQVGIEYVECNYTCVNNLAEKFWDGLGYNKHSITARKFI